MRIERLHLERYGHFEDRTLDLSGDGVRLHVVYGPNEAGKSTSLAAIGDLLFGIHDRTPYAFRHDYGQLRIGAELSNRAGETLAFKRRKGRVNTLLSADGGSPLPDSALAPFLGGADRAFFERMFGLDHDRLRQGGDAMLAAGGDLGRSLFEAGSGVAGIAQVLERLDAEADALATTRKSAAKPFWKAVERWDEAQARMRADALRADDWTRAIKAVQEAGAARAAVDAQLADGRARRSRVQRLRRVLPILARLDELAALLAAHGAGPDLPDGFEAVWRAAQRAADEAAEAVAHAARRLEGLEHDLSAFGVPGPLPALAAEIERLHVAYGDVAAKRADLPKLERDLALGRTRLEGLIAQLGGGFAPEEAAPRVPPRPAVARLRARIAERHAIDTALDAARRQHAAVAERLAETEAALAELGAPADPAEAAAALAEAAKAGDADARLAEAAADEASAKEEAGVAFAALGLWTGSLAELAHAAFPDDAAVARQEQSVAALAAEREAAARERAQARAALARLDGDLAELTAAGAVPTPEAVQEARQRRDRGWRMIRRRYVEGIADDPPPKADLAQAYEEAVIRADDLVDRREREAQRVARFATLTRQRQDAERALAAAEARLVDLDARDAVANVAWAALWAASGLAPQTPAAMRVWLQRKDGVVRLADAARKAEAAVRRARAEAEQARTHRLHAARLLGLTGTDALDDVALRGRVAAAAAQAGETWGRASRLRQELAGRRRELDAAERALAEAQARLGDWIAAWAADLPLIGLAPGATPGEATEALTVWDEIQKEASDALQTRRRCDGIRADLEAHAAAVRALLDRASPALDDLRASDPLGLAPVIAGRLREAAAVASKRQELEKQRDKAALALAEAREAAAQAQRAVRLLRDEHGLADSGDAVDLARRSAERRQLRARLEQARRDLAAAGDGWGEAALRAEADGADPDALAAEDAAVEDEAARLQKQGEAAAQALVVAQQELAALRGRAGIGEAAAQAKDAGLEMAEIARRWMRLRAASLVLGRAVERYRSANEHPLVKRASEVMARIAATGDNPIERLAVDYAEADHPVLVGVRRDGRHCPVEGMSDGTRDQLFLALRIAAVERYAEGGEPLPFVADDLFITSDEDRTVPGIRALAELGRATQVLLFTHHRYVVEAAASALGEGEVRFHSLAPERLVIAV
ncbi:AAA family ATPase [Azospirillum sp.]|uniref:AAA family ATPase n=1 Tax=Azospirillum sp. TaxID=34012 RepID=UPI003D726ED3